MYQLAMLYKMMFVMFDLSSYFVLPMGALIYRNEDLTMVINYLPAVLLQMGYWTI